MIEEVIHNRTVNLKGGAGHNIAMDRVCEFLNAEFKGKQPFTVVAIKFACSTLTWNC